jgi:hypothetical protein
MAYNIKFGSWAKKLSEELNKIGLAYIWHDPKKNSVDRICKNITEICSDIE